MAGEMQRNVHRGTRSQSAAGPLKLGGYGKCTERACTGRQEPRKPRGAEHAVQKPRIWREEARGDVLRMSSMPEAGGRSAT